MEPRFYVYLHRRASDLTPMYVGKGVGNRAWCKAGRSLHWKRSVEAYGIDVAIVCTGLTHEQANAKEVELIAHFGRRDQKRGPLVNLTAGGDGGAGHIPSAEARQRISLANSGRKRTAEYLVGLSVRSARLRHSEETKVKMSESRRGEKSYMFGVPKSSARRQQIAATLKGRYPGELNPNWGKTHTEAARDKIRAARAGLIQCSNGMVFLGCEKAAEWVRTQGFPKASRTAIHAAVKGRIVKSYGLRWQPVAQ